MAPSSLPSEGAQREIFLVALKQFSDSCSAPDLIPDCPFSVDLPGGGRGCGEECEDLLSEHGRPRSSGVVKLTQDSEFVAERRTKPAPISGSSGELRAFDAMEIFYRNLDIVEISAWHSIALLSAHRVAVGHSSDLHHSTG